MTTPPAPQPRTLAAAAVVILVVALSACGGAEGKDTTKDPAPQTPTPTSTPPAEEATPTEPAEPDPPVYPTLALGETFEALEVVTTVTKVEVVDISDRADEGMPGVTEAFEAYVETCIPKDAAPWESSVFDYVAVTKAGRVIEPTALLSGVRDPAYQTFGLIQPGRCTEGWVQIVMDRAASKTVGTVEYALSGGTQAAWKVR